MASVLYMWKILVFVIINDYRAILDSPSSLEFVGPRNIVIKEGEQLEVTVRKLGVSTSDLVAVVTVDNDNMGDFVGATQVLQFKPGSADLVSVSFTAADDDIPENDEVFTFHLSVIKGDVILDKTSNITVTIAKNDDPHGRFAFETDTIIVEEEEASASFLSLRVVRQRGTIGQVTLAFQVTGKGTGIPGDDISPTSGTISFVDGQKEKLFQLTINPDNIPENDEEFNVTLSSPSLPRVSLVQSTRRIIIKANDAPVRFSQASYNVEEAGGNRFIQIPVVRGLLLDGVSMIGPITEEIFVKYYVYGVTATHGSDYHANNGTVRFSSGITENSIPIQIIDDATPEVEETLRITLADPTGSGVLQDPSTATVIIMGSDDPNGRLNFRPNRRGSLLVRVNEDRESRALISVVRSGGNFAKVTVNWLVSRNDSSGQSVRDDIGASQGMISFADGSNEANIAVDVVQDRVAEPGEMFIVQLLPQSVTGGAVVGQSSSIMLLIEDSDDAYGRVEFAPPQLQTLVTTTIPRELRLTIERAGGSYGHVRVNYTIEYNGNSDIMNVLNIGNPLTADLQPGMSSVSNTYQISLSVFLQMGLEFRAEITSAELVGVADLGNYNSPRLGSDLVAVVKVTAEASNGEVGFISTDDITVDEPDIGTSPVSLKLRREGTNGRAIVYWSILSQVQSATPVTEMDVSPMTGFVKMDSGVSEADIVVSILADNEPEDDETLTVLLTRIEPPDSQKIRPQSSVRVIISQNDFPGGVFAFEKIQPPLLEEEGSPLEVTVSRSQGDLFTKRVEYFIDQNGEDEFYGSANVLTFYKGERTKTFKLLAKGDGQPEEEETFTMYLRSYADSNATIAPQSVVTLRIAANDDPYGVIQFQQEPPIYYIHESSRNKVVRAEIALLRSAGMFGAVTVYWTISSNQSANTDFASTAGSVIFGPGQNLGYIILTTLHDEMPEKDESYTLSLTVPDSPKQARLGDRSTATVIIYRNDHPVYFKEPLVVKALEPSRVTLTVMREGVLSLAASVRYRTKDFTASYMSRDYTAVDGQEITFGVGQAEQTIQVDVLDDDIPEYNEEFFVELYDPQGDIVLVNSTNCTIVIVANDAASGVFSISPPLIINTLESQEATIRVFRDGGTFGSVSVLWQISSLVTGQLLPSGVDFMFTKGSVTFVDRQTLGSVTLRPVDDEYPELMETFIVTLTSVVGGVRGESSLLPNHTTATINILPSDSPYGLLVFARTLVIAAEDYDPGNEKATVAQFAVNREKGAHGTIRVVWEAYIGQAPDAVLSAIDMFLIGSPNTGVQARPDRRRAKTGTVVYHFSGDKHSYVTVPSLTRGIPDEFSISAWISPDSNTNGYILTQSREDSGPMYYSLRVLSFHHSVSLEFQYYDHTNDVNQVYSVTSDLVIQDGHWHYVVVSVSTTSLIFYLDAKTIGSKILAGSRVATNTSHLLVGAGAKGAAAYRGYMQDVRIYYSLLTQSDVNILFGPAVPDEVNVTSAYIDFTPESRYAPIALRTVDDDLPEPKKLLTICLIHASNGADLDQRRSTAQLMIEKSDNANGLFGFDGSCIPVTPVSEGSQLVCTVVRDKGLYGAVDVVWIITQNDNMAVDFVNNNGTVEFLNEDRTKTFTITVLDDEEPELSETFTILLQNATSRDGIHGSTATSAASINPLSRASVVVVRENDSPYGILELSPDENPPTAGVIPPRTSKAQRRVREESGTVNVLVVRAQGTEGTVTVEWRTSPGTATSSTSNPDFTGGAGVIKFKPGERHAYIYINILDNNIPEDDKWFTVLLINPTGGATLGQGSELKVIIEYSDGAYGVFQFSLGSLNVIAQETGDTGYNPVKFKVERGGGAIGEVVVEWETSENSNDIRETSGEILFVPGERESSIELHIRGDTVPELDETINIHLTNITKGDFGSFIKSSLTIAANDDPYGLFLMPASERPIRTKEAQTVVEVEIVRAGGTFGIVDVFYETIAPGDTHSFLPNMARFANEHDFVATKGQIRFASGQLMAKFDLHIVDDSEPEDDESVYCRITDVRLIRGEQKNTVPNSPRLAGSSETYAQIVILSNDNAYGIINLSAAKSSVREERKASVLNVTRTAGSFGTVEVKFRTIDRTARNGWDYTALSSDIIFLPGETMKPLPVEIIEDDQPELSETFEVELLDQITGGAVLGPLIRSTITILLSDDPSGMFVFTGDGVRVEEPDEGDSKTVSVTIARIGGTLGIIKLTWEARLKGELASSDVAPVTGLIHFVSNQAYEQIQLNILADNVPEDTEDVVLTLTQTRNGGTIGDKSRYNITILANDEAFGTFSFTQDTFNVTEDVSNSTQHVTVRRRGGTFRDVRLYYQVSEKTALDIIRDVHKQNVLSYFTNPVAGTIPHSGTEVDVAKTSNPEEMCAELCLTDTGCASFQVTTDTKICTRYTAAHLSSLQPSTTSEYYVKMLSKVRQLSSSLATIRQDFSLPLDASVIIPSGQSQANLPLTVVSDGVPELDEYFKVSLVRCELVTQSPVGGEESPKLGSPSSADVMISANDDAKGRFRIYSDSPTATDNGQVVLVEERGQLAVDLIVEREGGNIGEVSVRWSVNEASSTATKGSDYLADGAILTFPDRRLRIVITLTILDDLTPEDDEDILVEIREATGGAVLSTHSYVRVIVTANDNAAGRLAVYPRSVIVQEGETIDLTVSRKLSAIGVVSVNWTIASTTRLTTRDFQPNNGTITFQANEMNRSVVIEVVADRIPELKETHVFQLTDVLTTGVRKSGEASINPLYKSVDITIAASDSPHGIVAIARSSLLQTTLERDITVSIVVERMFGAIGNIRIGYEVKGDDSSTATSGMDYHASPRPFIDLDDGITSGVIHISIIDDDSPEMDESFLVTLTSVAMRQREDGHPPKLDGTAIHAKMTILANDGALGVFNFTLSKIYVQEEVDRNVRLVVMRSGSTRGRVNIPYTTMSHFGGAIRGADYIHQSGVLRFGDGENLKTIMIRVNDDDIPEIEEVFYVRLLSPEQEAASLAEPTVVTLVINASEDASGVIRISNPEPVTLTEPRGSNQINSRTTFHLDRNPGYFGRVTVQFRVTSRISTGDVDTDITPVNGTVTFLDHQSKATVTLVALEDQVPELKESFLLVLSNPTGGAKMGTPTQAVISIRENDHPYGLLSIHPIGSRNSVVDVEEDVGDLQFTVFRSHGSQGEISVKVKVTTGSAMSPSNSTSLVVAPAMSVNSRDVIAWYGFTARGTNYLIMLTGGREGRLVTPMGSGGEDSLAPTYNASGLYTWTNRLQLVQSLETDGATSATSFLIDGSHYVFITNAGSASRRGVKSRLYRINDAGSLIVMGDINTVGASDVVYFHHQSRHFLVISYYVDSTGNTHLDIPVYRWHTELRRFTVAPWQMLAVRGVKRLHVFTVAGDVYLAAANHYDSVLNQYSINSVVYKLRSNQKFSVYQYIGTHGATDVTHITIGAEVFLVFLDSRSPEGSVLSSDVVAYRLDHNLQRFVVHQRISVQSVRAVRTFIAPDRRAYIAVSSMASPSVLLVWDALRRQFHETWSGPHSTLLAPVVTSGQREGQLLAMVNAVTSTTTFYEIKLQRDSDYEAKDETLVFGPGEREKTYTMRVIDDSIPEDTESFRVSLSDAVVAEISGNQTVTVNIKFNDNAHGIIEFAQRSVMNSVVETPLLTSVVQLQVLRYAGHYGHVVVEWQATGDHSYRDISPTSGTVEFSSGQTSATVSLFVADDTLPELTETTVVRLTRVLDSGTHLPHRGATIGKRREATVHVLANDSPHGVVLWAHSALTVTEPEDTDKSLSLEIYREQGTTGAIQLSYEAVEDNEVARDRRAISGKDYVVVRHTVTMASGVNRTSIIINILQDDIPEADELFHVNITRVSLLGQPALPGAGPSVRSGGNLVSVTIRENDNASGIVQFNVVTNVEGVYETYEALGEDHVISLRVERTVAYFGSVLVNWQVFHRDTNVLDLYPTSGVLQYEAGQEVAYVNVTIVDDSYSEDAEMFDVKLISQSKGVSLGPYNTVRVVILKNDSPHGIFGFSTSKVHVRESLFIGDPGGRVHAVIVREFGSEGVVSVQWRVSAEALNDFQPPYTGTVVFSQRQTQQTVTINTLPDSVLEGEETFTVSIISVSNNAVISPTKGDMRVVIAADRGASGLVTILPAYRTVYIGETNENDALYTGQTEIMLSRGQGVYGEVTVTWAITPRDLSAFAQLQGVVTFFHLQQMTVIVLKAIDDNQPERRTTFNVQLTSATGGARISSQPNSYTASVVYVASDYPHGLFGFMAPPTLYTTEDVPHVSVSIVRDYGLIGRVRVYYMTTSGTAFSNEDFIPARDSVVFESGQSRQSLRIIIKQDTAPEGPEKFYINVTSAELLSQSTNNYTTLENGLRLDMPPSVGENPVQTVVIEKSDNAEGTVQFDGDAPQPFTVSEEVGVAKIPLIREGGAYGRVRIMFTTLSGTATLGVDFMTPHTEVIMEDGEARGTVDIIVIDDTEREFDETFVVKLTYIHGGAKLGALKEARVTILKSDYPNGKFGFTGDLSKDLPNIAEEQTIPLTITRSHGLLGKQTVSWRIMGPNSEEVVLQDTSDIAYSNGGVDVTNGRLIWGDGESGKKNITLRVKPRIGWEVRKTYVVTIHNIQGSSVSIGNGEFGPPDQNYTISIERYGQPNGVVGFIDTSQPVVIDEPMGSATSTLNLPFHRQSDTGAQGDLKIYWEVNGPTGETVDVTPMSGSVTLLDGVRSGEITIQILPDEEPELTETFTVRIVRIDGGADVDEKQKEAEFRIKYNDAPHGLFGVDSNGQQITVDPFTLHRRVQLNVSRFGGTHGSVIVTCNIRYDKPGSGILVDHSTETLRFEDAQKTSIKSVTILGNGFLPVGSVFHVSLLTVNYIGAGVTDKPKLRADMTEARVTVPPNAANSEVGFETDIASIDEETNRAVVKIKRRGSYGAIEIKWVNGHVNLPSGYTQGIITPDSGSTFMPHAVPHKSLTVQVEARLRTPELFAIHLHQTPVTTAPGGARLMREHTQIQLEPAGVVRFSEKSRNVTGSELAGLVELVVERMYGSLDKVAVTYEVGGGNATEGMDYVSEQSVTVIEPGLTHTKIVVILKQDSLPEHEEDFYVRLTKVHKFPLTSLITSSPRLSSRHTTSRVIIKESDDPYGRLSLEPESVVVEEPSTVLLLVRRSGGSYGSVSVTVRTVGGGERWTSQIAPTPGGSYTIGDALANRTGQGVATGGEDYDILDTTLNFETGVTQQTIKVTVTQDDTAEAPESFFVYLTRPTGRARIASGKPDDKSKGYSRVTIAANDMSNGLVGFAANSRHLTVNEDTSPTFTLTLQRQLNYFGSVQVLWRTMFTRGRSNKFDEALLSSQLLYTSGNVTCPPIEFCHFHLSLIDDQTPEEKFSFVIMLYHVTNDAMINNLSSVATIDVEASDYIRGLVQFVSTSRVKNVDKDARTVRLQVERVKGRGYDVSVSYHSDQMPTTSMDVSGVTVYQAREGTDYKEISGDLEFAADSMKVHHIDVDLLLWLRTSGGQYPKQFYVRLHQPTKGLRISKEGGVALVRLVEKSEIPVWDAVSESETKPTNDSMMRQLNQLQTVLSKSLSVTGLKLIETILDSILTEAARRRVPETVERGIFDSLCKLLDPRRTDATLEASQLLVLMERFSYALLTGLPCESSSRKMMEHRCINVQVSAARWKLDNIRGYEYQGSKKDTFSVPLKLIGTKPADRGCEDIHFIEYFSDHWFKDSARQSLLNNKVISFGIRNLPSKYIDEPVLYTIHTDQVQVDPTRVRCVYYDVSSKSWTASSVCEVITPVSLHPGDHIDCSCKHLSHYSVQSRAAGWGTLGVPLWFYISCFINIACYTIVILMHHACPDQHTFAASLHMHLCASCIFTQICYLVAIYLSASDILIVTSNDDNYRCIIMGIFLHYFFLTQFSWMMSQAINFWRLLILNDEHTNQKCIRFFFVGWGVPVIIVVLFYVVTFVVFKYGYSMATQYIYGDVNGNGNICFVTNVYAGLAGVILPVALMLIVIAVVFVKAYQVSPQWHHYDDIYRARYNDSEVRSLLCLWLLIVMLWVWSGLHVVYSHHWMLILFTITNLIQALYVLVMYTFMRHPIIIHKIKYLVTRPSGLANAADFTEAPFQPNMNEISRSSLINDGWDVIDPPKLMTIQRTLPYSDNMFINPNFTHLPDEPKQSDFDDLIYALKNGDAKVALSDSDIESQVSEMSHASHKPSVVGVTRTPIADTHL